MTKYKVYWTEGGLDRSEQFNEDQFDVYIKRLNELHTATNEEGSLISFVASAFRPDTSCVSKRGVGVTDGTYDWKKRRM